MKSNCNKTSNNKYFECPARMSDGRIFTDYRGAVHVDDLIRYTNKITSNYDYRMFLTHNAEQIMVLNNNYTKDKVQCTDCNFQEVPFQQECVYNQVSPKCRELNKNGVGLKNVGIANQMVDKAEMTSRVSGYTPNDIDFEKYISFTPFKRN